MAFKIERALTGLFGALKLQSQGNLPRYLSEEVRATVDLTTFVLNAVKPRTYSIPTGGAVSSAVGISGSLTTDEDLYLVGANIAWNAAGAGQTVTGYADVTFPGDQFATILAWIGNDSSTGAAEVFTANRTPPPHWPSVGTGSIHVSPGQHSELRHWYLAGADYRVSATPRLSLSSRQTALSARQGAFF